MNLKRKHPLLKCEIRMLQLILQGKAFPTEKYKRELVERLDNLKSACYTSKENKK